MFDFKREQKMLYQPKREPSIIEVPEMTFIAIDGAGDPNTSEVYAAAVRALYGLSYTIKMGHKSVMAYVVPPLEGFWDVGGDFRGGGAPIPDKAAFTWTMMIRQPDFVTNEVFEAAKNALSAKKAAPDTSHAHLMNVAEGLCVQAMHIGPYDDEPSTIATMDRFAADSGYVIDISENRRHHEIYVSDPRKTAPDKLKTVIRHPVRRPNT